MFFLFFIGLFVCFLYAGCYVRITNGDPNRKLADCLLSIRQSVQSDCDQQWLLVCNTPKLQVVPGISCEPLTQFGGHYTECSNYHWEHWCLFPPHLLELFSKPLLLLQLLVFIFCDVAVTRYSNICHYSHLPWLALPYNFHLVRHHQFVCLYLKVPHDLTLNICHT